MSLKIEEEKERSGKIVERKTYESTKHEGKRTAMPGLETAIRILKEVGNSDAFIWSVPATYFSPEW